SGWPSATSTTCGAARTAARSSTGPSVSCSHVDDASVRPPRSRLSPPAVDAVATGVDERVVDDAHAIDEPAEGQHLPGGASIRRGVERVETGHPAPTGADEADGLELGRRR